MKNIVLFSTFLLLASVASAETVVCTGRTNDPNTTAMDFEVSVTGKLDKFTGGTHYKSIVKFTTPDGSNLIQGIDLNGKPRVKTDKIIYTGINPNNFLKLSLGSHDKFQGAIINEALAGMNQLAVNCELVGAMPERAVCSSDKDKNKSLIQAILYANDIDPVESAVSCGADVNLADRNGCTPMMFAFDATCGQNGSIRYQSPFAKTVQVLDLLIDNGAIVAVTDLKGETPLLKAAKYGIRDVYASFIAAEADFDAQDKSGNTALMYAATTGDAWLVQEILEGNPDRRKTNRNGETAYDIAKRLQKSEVIDLVKAPDATVAIQGQADGTCSPLQINLKEGQTVEFVLKASDKMFKLDAKTLGLDLMAGPGAESKQTLTLNNSGSFAFTCGYHGANNMSRGKITVQ